MGAVPPRRSVYIQEIRGKVLKTARYLRRQNEQAYTYRDYIRAVHNLGEDVTQDVILWPPRLRAAHDRVAMAARYTTDRRTKEQFEEMSRIAQGLTWKHNGIIIRPAATPEELVQEGATLKHCVGGYAKSHASGRIILFIRHERRPERSWYTLNVDLKTKKIMRTLVKEQYGRVARALPVKLAAAGGFTPTIQCQVSLKNLFTVLAAMAKAGGLGFRVYADPAVQALFFEVYEGVDRTEGQEENARVTFSNAYFNIDDPKYQENEANYKNYAIVCGAGEGLDRTIVEVDRTSGEDRRELLVDARDLSQGEQTEDEYKAILTQRGHDKLDEHNRIQSFEAGIKSSSQFRYTEDWNLGDIVTGRQTEWGVSMDQRVTEVEEIYENDTMTVVPTLGTPAPETYNLEDNIA